MGQILRHWQVLSAGAISILLIVGALYLAQGGFTPTAAASTESELLEAIAARDTDGDGLPDWEEALYGTDPQAADTNDLGMTDGEAVARGLIVPKAIADVQVATSTDSGVYVDPSLPPAPAEGTLTAAFTQNFFMLYLAAKQEKGGEALSSAELKLLADEALASLASSLVRSPDFKSARDLTVSGSGPEALRDFAAKAEAVLLSKTSAASAGELEYLQRATEQGDPEALASLASIAKAYRESAAGLAVLTVPEELAETHLALVNTLMRLSEIISDFARVDADSLAAILALQQYPDVVLALGTAFMDIANIYAAAGLSLAPGTPGAAFVSIIESVPEGPAPDTP